jgi:hypothetical protein
MAKKETKNKVKVITRSFAQMLSDDVTGKLKTFCMRETMKEYDCLLRYNDQGPRGEHPPIIPYAPLSRSRIHTGTRETGSYNHHSQVVKFKGKFYFAWSNGLVDEENAGQRILLSSSVDAVNWSAPITIAGNKEDPVMAHNCCAMKATKKTLYIVGMKEDTHKDAAVPGMRRIDPGSQEVSVYGSDDGKRWKKVFQFTDQLNWIFEAPKETADGHLLCVAGMKNGAAILRWPGKELCVHPEVISVPQPYGSLFPYGEGTWYQTADGTIVVFWRDEGQSCRLWVNYSTDNGKTFSEPMISDIPDSMSRVSVGRLSDGRYFLCNNAFPVLLNRLYLMLMLSDDGYEFNKVYLLPDDPTRQRVKGLLKVDGYQYPICFSDSGRLYVGYSINKEDIECGVVEVDKL